MESHFSAQAHPFGGGFAGMRYRRCLTSPLIVTLRLEYLEPTPWREFLGESVHRPAYTMHSAPTTAVAGEPHLVERSASPPFERYHN
jgi:hypothetical protein